MITLSAIALALSTGYTVHFESTDFDPATYWHQPTADVSTGTEHPCWAPFVQDGKTITICPVATRGARTIYVFVR